MNETLSGGQIHANIHADHKTTDALHLEENLLHCTPLVHFITSTPFKHLPATEWI